MKIRDVLALESIELAGEAATKQEALDKMVALMEKSGKINDVEIYRKGVYEREKESTTGIGEGIAIPHCKSGAVSRPGLAAMVVKGGVDFDALDGEKVDLIFLIAAPDSEDNVHLDVLSKLSVLLMDESFTKGLRQAKTVEEFLQVIDKAEAEKDAQEETKNAAEVATEDKTDNENPSESQPQVSERADGQSSVVIWVVVIGIVMVAGLVIILLKKKGMFR